jgi:hypothetical protein
MTPQQILIVAVRLFAVFWFLTSIGHLVTALRTWNQYAPDLFAALGLLVAILELAVCLFLWLFPATLSRRLLKGGDTRNEGPAPALLEWQAMLLVALGLWTLSFAVPDAFYWITYFLTYSQTYESSDVLADQWPYVVATIVQLTIGIWLLLGAPKVAALLFRLRAVGLRK